MAAAAPEARARIREEAEALEAAREAFGGWPGSS